MRVRTFQLVAAAGTALLLSGAAFGGAHAQSPAPALTGQIIAADQARPMEGVLVSAQQSQSPITITVVSDQNGRFSFPAAKLAPGHYALRIRATGYELDTPQAADVARDQTTSVDLKLRKAADLAAQLTNTEWFMSFPGTTEQKRALIECMSCHTLERIARSKFSADEFMPVLKRMTTYANNTIQARVQKRVSEVEFPQERARKVAEYLATVNLSKSDTWSYPLQTLPRPTGAATRVVITEYALPRATIAPHDVRTDANGFVWYSDFVENDLGRLDPKTGALKEFPYPELKPGFPTGALALEPDSDGNLWLAMMFQAGLAKFDMKTETFRLFPVQSEINIDTTQQSLLTPRHLNVDGKVWTNDVRKQAVLRLDVATGKYEVFDPFTLHPQGPPAFALRHGLGRGQQSLFHGFRRRERRPHRRQDRAGHHLSDADAAFAAAPHHDGPAGPRMVRRVRGRQGRHVRSRAREIRRMERADAAHLSVRRLPRPERRIVERQHVERPHPAHGPAKRKGDRVSAAASHQHPPRLRRRQHQPGHLLGRQQSRRRDHQARAAWSRSAFRCVIAGLVPAISARWALCHPHRDGRNKSGHDNQGSQRKRKHHANSRHRSSAAHREVATAL